MGPSAADSSTNLCDGHLHAGIAVSNVFQITTWEKEINRFGRTSIIGLVRLVMIINNARALDSTCKPYLAYYSADNYSC